jgi:hypothetical protein
MLTRLWLFEEVTTTSSFLQHLARIMHTAVRGFFWKVRAQGCAVVVFSVRNLSRAPKEVNLFAWHDRVVVSSLYPCLSSSDSVIETPKDARATYLSSAHCCIPWQVSISLMPMREDAGSKDACSVNSFRTYFRPESLHR